MVHSMAPPGRSSLAASPSHIGGRADVVKHASRYHYVEAGRCEPQQLPGWCELDPGHRPVRINRRRPGQHFGRDVGADDPETRSREVPSQLPGAAAEIEHAAVDGCVEGNGCC